MPENDLSLMEIEKILEDSLFSKLVYVNLNGGEPTLRLDLAEIVTILIAKLPQLKTITLNSNGLDTNRVPLITEKISSICKKNNIRFSISISLHNTHQENDKISGVKESYVRITETLDTLKEIQKNNRFYLAVNCVITNLNLYNAYEMIKWSENHEIPINFTLGEVRQRFNNLDMKDIILIENSQKIFLVNFFLKLSQDLSLLNQHTLRYREIAEMITLGRPRRLSCHYAMGGLILGSDGLLYYCKKGKGIGSCRDRSAYEVYYNPDNLRYRRKKILDMLCPSCIPNTFIKQEFEKDIFKYLLHIIHRGIRGKQIDGTPKCL